MASHPLDPLSADEIRAAAAIIRSEFPEGGRLRFALLHLEEPPKSKANGFEPGDPISRRVRATLLNRGDGSVHEATVSLADGVIVSSRELCGVQPPILLEEILAVDRIVKSDELWRAAVLKRGVTDLDLVQVDPWSSGDFPVEGVDPDRRVVRAACYVRLNSADNGYAKPIENVLAVVDLNNEEVLKVFDGEVVPIPSESGNYDADSQEALRSDLRPLDIIQADGPSFTIEGSLVRWQKWSVRVSMHPTDGLVLHQIAYDDDGKRRSVLYRASLSEMVVPYGDATEAFHWRNAFDAGEYGIGRNTGSLSLGCDCLGEVRYMDATLADDNGDPYVLRNAVCLHEEDFSILWKHWDLHSGSSEVRRSRRLVISSIATLGNYEYAFYWYFYLDGHIEFEIKLTGIVQTRALPLEGEDPWGSKIAPQLSGVNHQHIFNMRLDFAVDGEENSVVEVDTVAHPAGEDNPHLNAFGAVEKALTCESEAQRTIDPLKSRHWKVLNPRKLNRLGQPVAYKLVPSASSLLLASEDSRIAARARFAEKHLWVTPFHPDEMHAAGDYPNQSSGEDGLPCWMSGNRNLLDTDIVAWHTFGVSHIVRPEDWPIMPVESIGFHLLPVGFFDRNPSLDVPPPSAACQAGSGCEDDDA